MNRIARLLVAVCLSLLGMVMAQSLGVPAGIPPEYAPLLTVAIGVVTGWLVYPLTAIAKKLGRTSGPTTVAISAALSLLVALGLTLVQASTSRGDTSLWPALGSALLGWVQANGSYIARAQAISKGNALSPQPQTQAPATQIVIGEVQPPEGFKQEQPRPSGVEAIPGLDTPAPSTPRGLLGGDFGGMAIGAVTNLISSPLLELAVGVLTSAFPNGAPKELSERFLTEAIRLAPELLDGSGYISQGGRQRLNGLLLDLKAGRI